MIGNHEMDVDRNEMAVNHPDTHYNPLTEPELLNSSTTPVKLLKKRKIADQQAEEDEVTEIESKSGGDSKKPTTLSTPNNGTRTIKADMKRLLQSADSELSKYYQIKSNNKLVLIQGQCGEAPYRNHPDTIKELDLYFEDCKKLEETVDFIDFLKTKYSGLIAKLSQDSQVSQAELLTSLRAILFPLASGLKEFAIDSSLLDGIVEKLSYGHPEVAGNNFTAWSCTFWQVKDLNLLGDSIGKHYLTNYVIRNAAKMILETCLMKSNEVESELPLCNNLPENSVAINLVDDDLKLMKIESGTGTPKKSKKSATSAPTNIASTTTNNVGANVATPQVKISSFFAKLKKPEGIEKVSGEYFQPFFVKPNVTLAPINQLRPLKLEVVNDSDCAVPSQKSEYWKQFKENAVKVSSGGRQTCLCVGYDGRSIRAVLKLLKFEENYRPAYLGTWRKTAPSSTITPRRPFAKLSEIDYEYDSDAEWDEGEDPEGESLSDLDDDEEEEEDEEEEDVEAQDLDDSVSCAESADSWLVPHGYLSDDEGVDEVHPGELEEAEKEAELIPSSSSIKQKRKKFIPKEPVLFGPFHHQNQDQVIPQCLQGSSLQFIDENSWKINPFLNYDSIFLGLESVSTRKSLASEERGAATFPDTLLPSLIQIVNENLSAGITKLYDEFVLKHGKVVTRRLFESKLNQITTGKAKSGGSGGKMRWIFKDEFNVKNFNDGQSTKNDDSSSNIMQID